MAITQQHFAFINKYVAHFVAQSLLSSNNSILKNAQGEPFSQALSHSVHYQFKLPIQYYLEIAIK